jgi:hypothetical protein
MVDGTCGLTVIYLLGIMVLSYRRRGSGTLNQQPHSTTECEGPGQIMLLRRP